MQKYFTLLVFLCCWLHMFAQETDKKQDSVNTLKEVVVTGFLPNSTKSTSLNIEPYSLNKINQKAPFNLSDALAKIPGISQITTGNAISKPVIRGLYGNRILMLLSGLRFDNQQWQDEHGLGLSQIGIDRVEVIKGPASLLYGSDALGGVVNIIEEKPLTQGKKIDWGTQLCSNSQGILADIGYSNKTAYHWWRIRGGYENHADYSDGNNTRILNSRNNGYYVKAGYGFDRTKWKQENSYNFSYNQYGFILEDLNIFFDADKRWSRAMAGPHHIVILNLLNSQNTFPLQNSLLKLNVGIQSNIRMEDEGGGQISLNMHLTSALQNMRWEKKLSNRVSFVGNQQFTYEKNINYGGRIIIPDANLMEANLSGYFKFFLNKLIIETGAGGNYKNIKTFQTKTLNAPGEAIQPFNKNNFTANGMIGFVYNPSSLVTLKSNVASGFRAPNLAELSSNGLHEGSNRYEIGDPQLKTEQNVNVDISVEHNSKSVFLSASGFYNNFFNYVYLAPTAEIFFGFPVYRYKQQNAALYGGEFFAVFKPVSLKYFQWKAGLTLTRGKLDDGNNLPFIPAYKISSSVRFEKDLDKAIRNIYFEPEVVYVFKQDKPARFETPTPSYALLNFSSGITIADGKGDWHIVLVANNMANKAYTDHLSRLKYYGLLNEGINIVASVRKEIKW